jgi:hypothetical protein
MPKKSAKSTKTGRPMGRPRLIEGSTEHKSMLFSKEQLRRARAWGNRQKPRISETEAIRRLVDLALNCPGINNEITPPPTDV